MHNTEVAALYDAIYLCTYFFDADTIEKRKAEVGIKDIEKKAEKFIRKHKIKVPERFRALFSMKTSKSFIHFRLMDLYLNELNVVNFIKNELTILNKMENELCKYYHIKKETYYEDILLSNLSEEIKISLIHIFDKFCDTIRELPMFLENIYVLVKSEHEKKYKYIEKVSNKLKNAVEIQGFIETYYAESEGCQYYVSIVNDFVIEANCSSENIVNIVVGEHCASVLNIHHEKLDLAVIGSVLVQEKRTEIIDYLSRKDREVSANELSRNLYIPLSNLGAHLSFLTTTNFVTLINENGNRRYKINRKHLLKVQRFLSEYFKNISNFD